MHYQWQFQGADLPGETQPYLRLVNARPEQAGSYSVVVSNICGRLVSQPAELSVAGIVGWGFSADDALNVPSAAMNVVGLSALARHCLALRADGTVVAWGADYYGQTDVPAGLDNGNSTMPPFPARRTMSTPSRAYSLRTPGFTPWSRATVLGC
jgi:hypothetical protein